MKLVNIPISDFEYTLPDDRIAWFPKEERAASKLLIYREGEIASAPFVSITDNLPENSLIFFNNTRVIEARIIFQKPTGARIEVFLLNPADKSSYEQSMQSNNSVAWECLIGGASKWKPGQILEKKLLGEKGEAILTATYRRKTEDGFVIELAWNNPEYIFEEILRFAGNIPLPPYIKIQPQKEDFIRYQTSYAKTPGSVAAPTAGLHFTPEVLKALEKKGIGIQYLTLHVGAGTFRPVKTKYANEHTMHSETFIAEKSVITALLKNQGRKVTAVGTTSMRTLESIYWLGVMIHQHPQIQAHELRVPQWMPYEEHYPNLSAKTSLEALLKWLTENNLEHCYAETEIMIVPGYEFKICDILITNFHQPGSTLLLLVAAFIGDDWKKVYEFALKNDFRFLSYGDSSILIPKRNHQAL